MTQPLKTKMETTRENTGRQWVPVVFSEDQPGNGDSLRILQAADAILAQGEALLGAVEVGSYATKVPAAFNATMGGHYRHCLDHFASILRGVNTGVIDYDHRERDSMLESNPEFARATTAAMRGALAQLPPARLDERLDARCEVSYAHGHSPIAPTTLARELVYAIAHAIHHYALISIMARLLEIKLPENFGVAPSTVLHQRGQSPA